MVKKASLNVYDAAIKRIEYLFNEFDNVLVSFSGGKDSGVMLNLCYDFAKKTGQLNKLALYHLDYEAQYEFTTNYVTETFLRLNDIRRFWLCLPVGANCGCKMDSATWVPWKKEDRAIWCREMPKYDFVINEDNAQFSFDVGEEDYSVQDKFCRYFSEVYGKTAVMIGIRTQESLNRFRAIFQDKGTYKNQKFTTEIIAGQLYNAYPIYDWLVEDIWTANARFLWPYNKIYDLYYQAGLNINQMRVANPFHSCGMDTLKLYKVIEPHTWGKLVSRVNGVNFAGIYGGTTAMGWKTITKPKDHTWKSYCYFLLSTLDPKTRAHYEKILDTSIKFWKEKGGAVCDETVEELKGCDGVINAGAVSPISTKSVIKFETYPDELPEVTNFREVPSYKRMCVCIMKNDYYCKYMGFAPTKEAVERRKQTLKKYQGL